MLDQDHPENMEELERHWPFRQFPLLLDDGQPVVETTCIIEHLQAHHPGPNRWIPDGDAGPAGSLPRPLLRPICHEQYELPGVRRAPARRIARPLWRRAGNEPARAPPMTGWRPILAMGHGPSATSSPWPIAPPRRRCSTPTGSRKSGRRGRGWRPIARACSPIRSWPARSTKPGPIAHSSRSARPTAILTPPCNTMYHRAS